VNLDLHKWHKPGEPPLPAMVQQPIGFGLGLHPQLVAPWLISVFRPEKLICFHAENMAGKPTSGYGVFTPSRSRSGSEPVAIRRGQNL
jgi:hypothetical protein